jgi:glycosyltransferase involved in cell wall biosynthesis
MFKVTIDTTPIGYRPTGVAFYIINLISALNILQEEENFKLEVVYQPSFKNWILNNRNIPECLERNFSLTFLPLPVRITNLILKLNFRSSLSYFEKYFGYPNILHGTNFSVYPCKHSLKVMTIYDLTFIKYQNYTDSVVKNYLEKVQRCLHWTDLVLTISESSKKDIIDYLQVNPEKIYVTPLASQYSSNYLPKETPQELKHHTSYDFSKPYLLFVSTIEPRKNINAIISAFNFLKKRYKIEHQLVLIGKKGWNYEPIFTAIENSPWKNEIHHLDYLSNELVALFYSKADVFLYPSHYEGFGLPVLEAMTLGTPVITSNTSSIPEVTGNAAILIDPDDYNQLAEAILQVISNSQLRQNLINKGKIRADLFSWERTAKETLKAYRSII